MKLAMKRSAVTVLPLLGAALILLWLPKQSIAQRRGSGGEQAEGSSAPTAADTAAPAPPGNVENGKKLWASVGCYQCHGYAAQGGAAGARWAPPATPPFAFVLKYVRAPKGEMPPYTSKVLSDAQLADIYAFVKSIPKPSDAKDIPILSK